MVEDLTTSMQSYCSVVTGTFKSQTPFGLYSLMQGSDEHQHISVRRGCCKASQECNKLVAFMGNFSCFHLVLSSDYAGLQPLRRI